MTESESTAAIEQDENELIAQRKLKLKQLREHGQPYPNHFKREDYAGGIIERYAEQTAEALQETAAKVTIAGRLMTRRLMGKASFCHLQDMTGRIQVYVRKNDLGDDCYDAFKHWDIGDFIHVEGNIFRTKTGELSIWAMAITLINKSLRPLPDKYHGLADQELRYRQRYVDLIMSEQTRKTFLIRAQIIEGIREFLKTRQFLEVETPMMQVIPGGATARPFKTHHNALDIPLYLRIAPELYLKRLVIGGFERVFEINRNFRNEGLSVRHNPEFTMLEFYQAYATYHDLMDLTEVMLRQLATAVLGTTEVSYHGQSFDFAKPFARFTVKQSILEFNPDIKQQQLESIEMARELAVSLGISVKDSYGLGKLQIEIFEKIVEHRLLEPTFITAYPTEVSPLARMNDTDPFVTDRFEFFVAGRELANGFSELNDPEDQAARFQQQVKEKEAGDDEAMYYDADYITALEYGMPPTAGEGIGIDRLTMLFTDSASIRDVILFPHMRPK